MTTEPKPVTLEQFLELSPLAQGQIAYREAWSPGGSALRTYQKNPYAAGSREAFLFDEGLKMACIAEHRARKGRVER